MKATRSIRDAAFLLLIVFAVSTSPMAGEDDAYVLFTAPRGVEFSSWRAAMLDAGVALRHSFPPAGGIAVAGELRAGCASLLPAGTKMYAEPPEGEDAVFLTATAEGSLLWHAHRALVGVEPLATAEPLIFTNSAWRLDSPRCGFDKQRATTTATGSVARDRSFGA